MADYRKRDADHIRDLEEGRGPLITALIIVVIVGVTLIVTRVL